MSRPPASRPRGRWALLLLSLPLIALLFPGWYAHGDPKLSGIPFYIWYQFLWVFLGVAVTGVVYAVYREREERP